ncbi:MAG TPA: glycosyltransferase [Nocardioides sp.]|uniref:glycosyltransferase family protein n=1 Tax=Nocardioides sp. TaxID=35761 RepID=UPI002D7EC3F5|nr:glycosyltransferase [Nocardioides sp.]HET6653929.1 glycosyltransferase [Nocardioides sp.]
MTSSVPRPRTPSIEVIQPLERRSGRRIALYSHDSQGLGHVRRNSLLAAALVDARPDVDVLLLSGAPEVSALPLPPRTEVVKIPSLAKDSAGVYGARSLRCSLEELVSMRTAILAGALTSFAPDLLIVDKTPRGAFGELDEVLPLLRQTHDTRTVLGLRDVLDDVNATEKEWQAARTTEAIRTLYDQVWVYGDPRLFDTAAEYGWSAETRQKVVYTGYLALDRDRLLPDIPEENTRAAAFEPRRTPFVLGLVGGGQDGAHVARAFAEARYPTGHEGVLVTGPYAPVELLEDLTRTAAERPDLQVARIASNVPSLVSRSSATVSMGGYNSTCELMAGGRPALLVPRTHPRKEQALRAARLAAHGLADVQDADDLTPEALSRWFEGAVSRGSITHDIDLAGLRRLPELVDHVLGDDTAPEEAPRDIVV